MVPPPDEDDGHDCGWKAYAKAQATEQQAEIADLKAQLAELKRLVMGKKSERRKSPKLPPPVTQPKADPEKTREKRNAANALRDAKLETEVTPIPVPAAACKCPDCGNEKLAHVGAGKVSTVFEYIPAYFRKRIYRRETLRCPCGYIVTAPPPERMGEKTRYAPSFVAHLIVSKCGDSMPQYRLEKGYRNVGIPISRSTMCELFHRAAGELRPLYTSALALVPKALDLHADETSFRQQDMTSRAFLWTFVSPELIVYRYAPNRSGETPKAVLGESEGRLVVDAYTGYNAVAKLGKRTRAGCLAHARRKFFEQKDYPEAQEALALIGEIYKIEAEAKVAEITGTPAHLALRKSRSRPVYARLLSLARKHVRRFEPRSRIARAFRYLLNNWRELGQFLRFASLPPDNNVAEASLRRVALGRANFLFVANQESGHNLAVLYTLVASCEKHGVNAIAYLSDVLIRIKSHPAERIEELLPHRWKPPDAAS